MKEQEVLRGGRVPVVLVPGGIMPALLSYGSLLAVLGDGVQAVAKELEVYAGATPPPDYGLELEVDSIGRAAAAAGFTDFHLVGYSAGGASSLAFAVKHPERLRSLALIEPAWIGNEGLPAEIEAGFAELHRVVALPPEERMPAFLFWQMRPGVAPPAQFLHPTSVPPWMAARPAGIAAIARAFDRYRLDRETLRGFRQPAYYALGSLSTPLYERMARVLAQVMPDLQIETYEGRSHLDPPHRAEPERFAQALRDLWGRAEAVPRATPPSQVPPARENYGVKL
jgi:pimeloyl-ACP methyl ester carboxylesterase